MEIGYQVRHGYEYWIRYGFGNMGQNGVPVQPRLLQVRIFPKPQTKQRNIPSLELLPAKYFSLELLPAKYPLRLYKKS